MKTVRELPRRVRELEHVEVPMPDGCRLAARIWLPEDAEARPVPAILEYIPYRKNDGTMARDSVSHPYTAGHGYAVVRLDLRGSGESEGLMTDEYTEQELQDGVDAIAWIAAQPWCSGSVGMVGISWGGFNGLQVAALQPPALKAVITLCSTDDRYADDVHFMGGCQLIDNLSWASVMFGYNTLPPDPRHRPDDWRALWLRRLTESGLWLKNWLEHQSRDVFWKHGSICEDYARVQVPVFAVSGWADGYCRTVFRLMEKLEGPRLGLVGPWAHKYPHVAKPGPAIGFLQESLRWWDRWLKGEETGIMEEPRLRLFLQHAAEPAGWYAERAGEWIAEPAWPSPNVERRRLRLSADGHLSESGDVAEEGRLSIRSPLTVGMAGGKWCSYAGPGDQPVDQRRDDAGSLVFETAPLEAPLDIAGDANLELAVSADRPVAQVAVRLVDVAPDGKATRVSYGLLNLTHRDGHETPQPLEPGRTYRVRVPFKHVAQRFEAGHRLRLSISSSYFPIAWPAPEPVTLTVSLAGTALELPVRSAPAGERAPGFEAPEGSPPQAREQIAEPEAYWRVVEDCATGVASLELAEGGGTFRILDNDLTITDQTYERYSVAGDDPASASGWTRSDHAMSRGDWRVRSVTETRLTCDRADFVVEARLRAWEGDELVVERHWSERIPRLLA